MNAANNSPRLRAEAEGIAYLARIVAETMEAPPEGEAPPATVLHALVLIGERSEILRNDIDVASEEARGY